MYTDSCGIIISGEISRQVTFRIDLFHPAGFLIITAGDQGPVQFIDNEQEGLCGVEGQVPGARTRFGCEKFLLRVWCQFTAFMIKFVDKNLV